MDDHMLRVSVAMMNLKVARDATMCAAKLLDDTPTRTCHELTLAAAAANDEAQQLVGDILSDTGPTFVSSMPERCDYHAESVPPGTDPYCYKEAGHEGPHMYGPDDPPPPA